jgi:hypothetical protein
MQVRIYKPTKTAMQSGQSKDWWVIEYLTNPANRYLEGLMGRTASKDMMNEVALEFSSKEEAIKFARSKRYSFEVIEPPAKKIIKKSYASNFR